MQLRQHGGVEAVEEEEGPRELTRPASPLAPPPPPQQELQGQQEQQQQEEKEQQPQPEPLPQERSGQEEELRVQQLPSPPAPPEQLEEQEDEVLSSLADYVTCPISFVLLTDPVFAEDGNTYQRRAIQQWFDKCTAGTTSRIMHGCRW